MKKSYFFLTSLVCLFIFNFSSFAQNSGINSTFVVVDNQFYDLQANTSNPDNFQLNQSIGSYDCNDNLIFNGGENNVFKCSGDDITANAIFYRVFKNGDTPGSFNQVNLGFASGFNNGCGGADQKWDNLSANIDLLSGLTDSGTYTIEVFSTATYTADGGGTHFASNNGANYSASFDYTAESTWYADNDGDGFGDVFDQLQDCVQPSGYFSNDEDCDDSNASINPNAADPCDGIDNNCDSFIDNQQESVDFANIQFPFSETICQSESLTVFGQVFEAGLTDSNSGVAPGIVVEFGTNGTDSDPSTWPASSWSPAIPNLGYDFSQNNDEYQATFTPSSTGTIYYSFRYALNGCDFVYGATNNGFWNGTGNNNGVLTIDPQPTWYADNDGDGFGDVFDQLQSCVQPSGYVSNDSDCDDTDASINPSAPDPCDGVDNNCDSFIDNQQEFVDFANIQFPASGAICEDQSLTVFGQVFEPGLTDVTSGQAPGITVDFGLNTSNTDPASWPESSWSSASFNIEAGNNDEYQFTVSGQSPGTYYYAFRYAINGCPFQYGATNNGFWNGSTNTNGELIVNAIQAWYADSDGDGFGDINNKIDDCDQPSGYVSNDTDCDDTNASINPSAAEICDGIDNDCDGLVDSDDPDFSDSTSPTALCVSDVTVELDATGNGTLTTAEVDAGSTDDCGPVTLTLSQTAFTCADIGGGGSSGPAITELFISEYIEGGGNNKCIEIYNGTGATVDLAAGNYAIIRYSNGSTSGTTINLTGTIADGDVYVVCNNSATSTFTSQSDQTSSQINFNGDDAVALTKNGSNIDIFGEIGDDPGSQWSVGGNMTANRTLVRNPEVLSSNTLNSAGFPTLGTEWTEFPQDTASNLGSHTVNTPSGGSGSTVTLTVTDASGNVATCDVNVTVVDLNGPVPDLGTLPDVNAQCEVLSLVEPTATDACGGTVTVSNDASLPITSTGTTVVTWTYTDQYGNETSQAQNIVIADTEAPTAVCQDITVELDASGNAILTPDLFDGGSSDNCDNDLSLSIDLTSVDCSNLGTPAAAGDVAWINEFHYDNSGADVNEFVEVAANFDASSYQIIFYNGSNGTSYGSGSLVLSSTDSGYNFYSVNAPSGGIQNGGPDGIALVNGSNVIEFISYEGSFTATNGPANGLTSVNVGVSQTSSTPIGSSIHRIGSGGQASDFTWANTTANTAGSINTGQTLIAPITGGAVVTLTVTDDAGNQSSCTANVTVLDTLAPSPDVVQLSDITAECEVVSLTAPSATDNCGGMVSVTNDASLPISTQGTTVITWTYEDESGNTSFQTQNIIINDTIAPEAICQDITVSLDANGLATWTAADINNGSTDNCGIQSIAIDNSTFDCNDVPKLLISGVIDGPLSGGVPKAVELYVLADIDDLSEFGLGFANNGGGTDGEEFTFPSTSVAAGTYIYIASEASGFTSFFGFAPDYTSGNASINGDDAIELFKSGTVIDVFGEINTDGTGEVWEYTDGWAYRNANTGPDGDVFNASNWTYSGTNALDGETDNNTATNPFPAGGFTTGSGISFSTSVILTVTDINGNTDTCTATVTVEDNIDPTIACPADITVNNDPNSCGAVVTFTAPVGSDNCAGAATTQTAGLESGSVFPIGTTINSFEVTDSFGNSVECSFTVTVIDNEAPSITCPADITVSNDSGACDAIVSYVLVSNDNCPDATITQTSGLASGEAFPIGTTTNTFEIIDASGNSNSCSFTVTVNDTEAPVLTCPSDITIDNDLGQCGAQVVYNVSGSDNCPNETLTQTSGLPSGSFFPVGTTTVSYELEDASGNLVSCSFDVTVNDSEAPTINCPSNIVAVNDAGLCSAVVNYTITSGDNCPGVSVTQTTGLASGSAFPIGITTNTFVITDAAGNTTSCSFDVQVNDAEAPIISCPTDITASNDLGACSAIINYAVNGSDNCPGTTITQTSGLASGSAFPIGITTNTFQITDAAGNTSTCSFNVIVNDTESPEINCPGNINVSNDPGLCGAEVTFAVTGSDNCSGTSITQTSGLPSGSLFPIGITVNTFTITDASGNSATCSFEVKVDDTEIPVITCPADIITGNDPGSCDAIVTYTIVSSDNCPGATIVQIEGLPSGAQFPIGDTMNKFEITDAAGNTTICNFLVTVEDTESPVPSASLPDIVAQCEATVLPPIAPDNCKGDVTGTTTDPTTYTAQGTYVITWLYDDGSGNTSTQTQNVIIDDTTAPETPILNPIVGQCFAAVPIPTTVDNCAGVISGTTTDATNYTAQGTYTVNWTFDDGNGNVITVPQTVIVDDVSNPVPDVANLPTLTAECSLDVISIPTATDNCLGVINATTNDPLTYSAQGTYTITWTYDDGNGNAVSQTQTVIIDDITAPDAVVLNDVIEQCSATVTAPTTNDNCAGVITGTTSDPLVYTSQGNYLITWNFDDGNGNSFNVTQNVIVNDTEAPVPDSTNLATITGQCQAEVTTVPTATDNCKGQIQGTTTDALTYNTQGVYTITWSYDDGNGNVSTQTQTVIVEDTVDPVISGCPSDITLCGAQAVSWTAPTASDNCEVTLTSTHEPGDLFDLGTTTVVYTATDAAGNTATCSFDVTINANPIISIVESPLDDFCQGIGELTVIISNESELQLPINISWSNGSNDESIIVNDNNTYTVTVSSGNGCSATASFASSTNPQDVLSGHVMIGKRGVRLFGSRVFGNVGVTDNNRTAQVRAFSQVYGFVRSDNIFADWFSFVQTPIYSDSDVTLPTFYNNTTPNNCGDDITVQPYTTVTLDEEIYDNVYVRYGATLIIDSPEVYINRLTTESGVTIIFNQPSAVMVDKQMRIGRYNTIDRNGNGAIFYVEKDVTIDRSADIDVNIYSKRSIKVRRSSFFNRTTMRGLFIALRNVESSFFVDWYPGSGCGVTPIPDGPSPCNSLITIDDDDDDDDDEFEADRVTLFPVPARDILNVTFESPTTTKASYAIASMRGEVSIQSAWDVEKGHNEEKVDVTRLSDGLYSIIINLNGETISKQFVVKRGK